jgi:hypothetical protein
MAPKTIRIQSLNTSAEPEPELKMAPKFKFMWILLLAEPKLKLNLVPKNLWITTSVRSALAPKNIQIYNSTIKSEIAPKTSWICNLTARLEIEPKLTWIRNFAVNITIKQEIASSISWIHNFTVRIEIPPKSTWIHFLVVKINRAIPTLILSYIELITARIRSGSNSLMYCYSIKQKDIMIHNLTVKLETMPNRNWIHNPTSNPTSSSS